MDPATMTLIILAIVAFLFVTEIIPLAVTSIGATISLGIFGIIDTKAVFSGLSDSTVVLFAGMFVVGAAVLESGLATAIGQAVVRKVGTNEIPLMVAIMLVTIIMSAFASNTGTVACLMPVVIGLCAAARLPVSPLLMAMAVAANTGGTITMVGTPPNIIASSSLESASITPFGFFEYAWIGVPLAIAGIIYMVLFGKRLVPHNMADYGSMDEHGGAAPGQGASRRKMYICTAILVFVIYGLCFGYPGISADMCAIIGALLCVLSGCLTEKQAYQGIDWVTIFLFAGMLPLAKALDKTGAGAMIAHEVVGLVGENPSPMFFMVVLFTLSCGMTQFMSNTAAAALLCPIGISIANEMGASPYPVIMAIAMAASCAFTTPVATPPNTLVMGPGGFRFKDYLIVGSPLVLASLLVCMLIIPNVWPFFPET